MEIPKQLSRRRTSIRTAVRKSIDVLGSGGIAAYVIPQDTLVLTDFNIVIAVGSATDYVPTHRLRYITEYTQQRKELPGIHILDQTLSYDGGDIRYRSSLSQYSMYVMDVMALVDAQGPVHLSNRYQLETEISKAYTTLYRGDLRILIGSNYYGILNDIDSIRFYSGVYDNFVEPTKSWKDMPLSHKGVYFSATTHNTIRGLIMPHAKISTATNEKRTRKSRASSGSKKSNRGPETSGLRYRDHGA